MKDCILLRYGEIALKSKSSRLSMEKSYIRIIQLALKRNEFKFKIENLGGRFIVYTDHKAIETLKRVAGIQSISPAIMLSFKDKNDLTKQFGDIFKNDVKNKTFALKIKRVGKHDFNSLELARDAAGTIYDYSKGVNLSNPDILIKLEVRNNECFVYTDSFKGVGGIPLTTSDNVLCLFSGGIDSPVAAYEMIKKGCKVDFLIVDLVGNNALNDVAKLYNYISNNFIFGYKPKAYIVDAKNLIKKIKEETPDSLRQIAFKIVLYKIGEEIANKRKHLALVSGEALSQKSSQTLKSLIAIEKQVDITMLRPLLTMDKIEITKLARNIGTLSLSEKVKEYCNLSEGKVTISPRDEDIKKIPLFDKEIKEICFNAKSIRGEIQIKENTFLMKKGSIVIDIRSRSSIRKKPLTNSIELTYNEALETLNSKTDSYIIICDYGVRSEELASYLRKKGLKAQGISAEEFLTKN